MNLRKVLCIPLFVLAVVVGCRSEEAETVQRNATATNLQAGQQATQPFASFWSSFKTAAESDDYEKLLYLSRVPFELKPAVDGESGVSLDASELKQKLPQLLEADGGLKEEPESMKATILSFDVAQLADADQAARARVGNFEFERIDQEWRFVSAYSDP